MTIQEIQREFEQIEQIIECPNISIWNQYKSSIVLNLVNLLVQKARYEQRDIYSCRTYIKFDEDSVLDLIDKAIARGANINAIYQHHQAPLEVAIDSAFEKTALLLLNKGSTLRAPEHFIEISIEHGTFGLLRQFFHLTATVPENYRDTIIFSVLYSLIKKQGAARNDISKLSLIQKSVFDLLEILIQKGANLHGLNLDMYGPSSILALAFLTDCDEILRLCLKHDLKIIYEHKEMHPITYAIFIHRQSLLRKILSEEQVLVDKYSEEIPQLLAACGLFDNLTKVLGRESLLFSEDSKANIIAHVLKAFIYQKSTYCHGKIAKIIESCIMKGADCNAIVEQNQTCLQFAIQNDWIMVVTTLLSHGAKLYDYDGQEMSFATYAFGFNKSLLLQIFEEHKHLFSEEDLIQFYALNGRFEDLRAILKVPLSEFVKETLIFSIIKSLPKLSKEEEVADIIKFSIEMGASPDAIQNPISLVTILMHAAENAHNKVCFTLIECGADVGAKDFRNCDLLDHALSRRNEQLSIDLINRYPNLLINKNLEIFLRRAFIESCYDLCQMILSKVRSIEKVKDTITLDILSYSYIQPEQEILVTSLLQQVIDMGANVDAQRGANATPLMLAVGRNLLGITKCLLENGANLHIKNNIGLSSAAYIHSLEMKHLMDEYYIQHSYNGNSLEYSGNINQCMSYE
jgi:ankyrin repeat protein